MECPVEAVHFQEIDFLSVRLQLNKRRRRRLSKNNKHYSKVIDASYREPYMNHICVKQSMI